MEWISCSAGFVVRQPASAPAKSSLRVGAKAGIQYVAASRFHHRRHWNTASPAFADDADGMCVRILATQCAQAIEVIRALPNMEGAGKTGCALHPRSRVQCAQQSAHTSIQVQRRASGLPCAMALRLITCSPRRTALLPPSPPEKRSLPGNLTPAPRRQDHTPLPYAFAPSSLAHPRPPLPVPRFVTIASAPPGGTGWRHSYP
jgi:hypothetical protein